MKKLTKRSKKGFTLVELIVVIAILAILAGVAIPVYSSYITKANEAADYAMLDAIKTAVAFKVTEDGVKEATPVAPEVTKITVSTAATNSVTASTTVGDTARAEAAVDVSPYFDGAPTFKSGATKAVWENGAWVLTK